MRYHVCIHLDEYRTRLQIVIKYLHVCFYVHCRTLWNEIHKSRYTFSFNSFYLLALCLWAKEFGKVQRADLTCHVTSIRLRWFEPFPIRDEYSNSFGRNSSWVSERQKSCEIFCILFSIFFSLSELWYCVY